MKVLLIIQGFSGKFKANLATTAKLPAYTRTLFLPLMKPPRIIENSPLARLARLKLKAGSVAMVLGRSIHLSGATREQFLRDPYFPLHAAKDLHVDLAWPVQYKRAKRK